MYDIFVLECIEASVTNVWCLDGVEVILHGASLHAMKPYITHTTSILAQVLLASNLRLVLFLLFFG